MCLKNLPIIQDDASSSAPKQFADVEPDNSIPEINVSRRKYQVFSIEEKVQFLGKWGQARGGQAN